MSSLKVESIQKEYPTRSSALVVLTDVSFSLRKGESATIMGPSGSGKSTLLNILGALEPPTSGRVTLADQDPYSLSEKDLAHFRNQKIGFVFQEHHLLPQCSVLENVLLPTLPQGGSHGSQERARSLLDRVGLSNRLTHRPSELSGGERQRVAIARSLINRPALLLTDEPTGNLDRTTATTVADLFTRLQEEEEFILIVVTHSPLLADCFSRRFELQDGSLHEVKGQDVR